MAAYSEHLLLDVPHRQIVLTLPKRLRPYLLYDRRRLGGLSRLAARVLSRYLQAALGDRDAAPGAIVCVQTFGSIAHWHPHLHVLLTDGAFTRGGRFLPAHAHDPALLQEALRRAVLTWFAREGWLEEEAALAMLAWPHSGFGAHVGPLIGGDDRESLTRVARYGARAPIAEDRVFEIEVRVCPACSGAMRIVAFVTAQGALRRILAHLDRRDIDARAGPWTDAAA